MLKTNAKHEPANDAAGSPGGYRSADEKRAAGKALRDATPRAAKAGVTIDRIVAELAKIGFSDVRRAAELSTVLCPHRPRQGVDARHRVADPGAEVSHGLTLFGRHDVNEMETGQVSSIDEEIYSKSAHVRIRFASKTEVSLRHPWHSRLDRRYCFLASKGRDQTTHR